jgi:hypothetical protein
MNAHPRVFYANGEAAPLSQRLYYCRLDLARVETLVLIRKKRDNMTCRDGIAVGNFTFRMGERHFNLMQWEIAKVYFAEAYEWFSRARNYPTSVERDWKFSVILHRVLGRRLLCESYIMDRETRCT